MEKANKAILLLILSVIGRAEAAGGGLSKVTSTFTNVESWLTTFVPIAATVALIFLAIGYLMQFVHKETFGHWAIGLIVAGSASEIVGMVFG